MIRRRLMTEINLASIKVKDDVQFIQFSEDMNQLLTNTLEQKFGGASKSHRAALIIQQAYRQFRIKKKLSTSNTCDINMIRPRNNSMPENLHYINRNDDASHSSSENVAELSFTHMAFGNLSMAKVKDSLSLLLPELRSSSMFRSSLSESSNTETENQIDDQSFCEKVHVQIGDVLSSKCDEDLERFQNDSKIDSTEDSDSSTSDKISTALRQSATIEKLPPPMPVISTCHFSGKPVKPTSKIKTFTLDGSLSPTEENQPESNNTITPKSVGSIRSSFNVAGLQTTRSPRDSGVSSHSSNTDLLTFDYSSQLSEFSRTQISPGFINQKIPSSSSSQKDADVVLESSIPPITEDTDSLFDNPLPTIPSIMTSSKDSGVDADTSGAISNQSHVLHRLSFQEKPRQWRIFHRRSCLTGCVNHSPDHTNSEASELEKPNINSPSSVCLSKSDLTKFSTKVDSSKKAAEKHLIQKLLQRIAINLFNRNITIGLKFMDDHKILNIRCPFEIATFLRSQEVHPRVVADFVSCRNSAFNLSVLRCYLKYLSLHNLNFLEAIDVFFRSFKVPEDPTKTDFLITQFAQYYIKHIQKCPGVDIATLIGLGRVMILLRSAVTRSRPSLSAIGSMSFADFIKQIQNCCKGQEVPYSMELLQKIYISVTRSSQVPDDPASKLIGRIENLEEPKSKACYSPKCGKAAIGNAHFLQPYRRLTYFCDVQMTDRPCKRLRKHEHLRSIFVFNDSLIVAKRLSRNLTRSLMHFRTDAKFQCRSIVSLMNYRIEKTIGTGSHTFKVTLNPISDTHSTKFISAEPLYFITDTEENCHKLFSKLLYSQIECKCVEQLRLHQWNCNHAMRDCICLTIMSNVMDAHTSFF